MSDKTFSRFMSVPLLLLIAIVGAYLIPPEKRSFRDLARGVPVDTVLRYEAYHAVPFQHVTVNGVRWDYRVRGTGPRSLLLLHGMGGDADIWWQQFLTLEPGLRIIAPTYPAVDHLEDLSAGILAILDAEDVPRTAVVGTSLGGYLAQYLLARHSDRLSRVILSNTFPPNGILAQRNGRLGLALRLLPEWAVFRIYAAGIEKNILPAGENSPLLRTHLLALSMGGMRKSQLLSRYQCVMQPFEIARAPAIPILIIEADNDPLVPAELRQMLRQSYPTARVVTFHEKGHFPYLNASNEFNRTITAFLNGR